MSEKRSHDRGSTSATEPATWPQAVADDGYRPDLILGIARGGLLIAGRARLRPRRQEHLHDERRVLHRDRRAARDADDPAAGARSRRLRGLKVLIADDVADTGATLELVKEFCAGKVAEVRCAVLYEKPRSVVKCEYVWRRTERWITFPWSADEAVLQAVS